MSAAIRGVSSCDDDRYPEGSHATGEVANVMSYGAFVRVEPKIEGFIHLDPMSSTQQFDHAREVVQIGDRLEVEVLNIYPQRHELSLRLVRRLAGPGSV